jgi:hypothetical protein
MTKHRRHLKQLFAVKWTSYANFKEMAAITQRMQELMNDFHKNYPEKINEENQFLIIAITNLMERIEELERASKN